MQFFLLIYCIVSAKKCTTMHAIESYTVLYNIDKNSYAMHYAYYKNYS